MSETTNPEPRYTLFLSPEQYVGCEGEPWIRDATKSEIAALEEANPGMVFDEIKVDQVGRPYLPVTIDGATCPPSVRKKAAAHLRVKRF